MLDDLVATIEQVQGRIRDHHDYYGKGGNAELRTRIGLIDPILCALGWDVSDPELVEIEPKTKQHGWADYALLGDGHKRLLFIEAKKLTESKDPSAQTSGYIFQENVGRPQSEWVNHFVTTNGDIWRTYTVTTHKLEFELELSKVASANCALLLLSLWRPTVLTGDFTKTVEISVRPNKPSEPKPLQVDGIAVNEESFDASGRKPTVISFPNNESRSVGSWTGVFKETLRWLDDNSSLQLSGVTSIGASKSFKVSTNRDSLIRPMRIGKTEFFAESNLSAKNLRLFATAMIERCGESPAAFTIEVAGKANK